jgi:hypothetical protein
MNEEEINKIQAAFDKNVTIKKTKHGYSSRCNKGLFGVDAKSLDAVKKESMHYFMQYYRDSEYDQIKLAPSHFFPINDVS